MDASRTALVRRATWLAAFTVAYNLAEGVVAIVAALAAGSSALLSFGLDSGVESVSAAVLLWRLGAERKHPERADEAERRALRLIGFTFFLLAAYVAVESIWTLLEAERPDASIVGIVLTGLSLIVMPVLAHMKRTVGIQMSSHAVTADAAQTLACVYLSLVVFGGLILNALLDWWWADPVAALVVVVFLVQEGREAFEDDDD